MENVERKQGKLKFSLIRFLRFMKIFLRNKRAVIGLLIILFFAFIAIFAPLLTSFTPLGDDPEFRGYVAAKLSKPTWLRYLPTWLGGDPYLSENFEVVKDAGAPNLGTELSNLTSNPELIDIRFDPNVGYPFKVFGLRIEPKAGSLAVKYKREAEVITNESKVYIYANFSYPYLGNPGIIIGNIELLANGSKRVDITPEEQWYIILASNSGKSPKNGSISISVDNLASLYVEDLYIAATTNITSYFGTSLSSSKSDAWKWKKDWGYNNLWEWLNGTSELPPHWDELQWTVSDGSLTVKNYTDILSSPFSSMYEEDEGYQTHYCFMDNIEICDPDLEFNGNKPDIIGVKPWIKVETNLTKFVSAGESKLYVASVEGFKVKDEIIIGSAGFEEINVIDKINLTENSLTLKEKLVSEHGEGEPVVVKRQKVVLYDNLVIPPQSRTWILVKIVLKDVELLYKLNVESPFVTTVFPGTLNYPFDIQWANQGLTSWQVYRRIEYLDVPVMVRVFLGEANQPFDNMTTVFPVEGKIPLGFVKTKEGEIIIDKAFSGSASNAHWIISRVSSSTVTSLIQFSDSSVINDFFQAKPGNYIWGVEITFLDSSALDKTVETVVYIDDFHLRLIGTSFGLMGTDQYGRDLFSQLVYGARISLYIGLLVSVFSVSIGLVFGLFAGFYGGPIDEFLMRTNDLLLVMPSLPLLIVLVAILGAKIENLIILLGLLGWNGFARVVRSMVLSIKERPFIEAAKAAGAGTGHIIVKHILPCVMAIVYVSLATSVPGAITAEAALSWLGFYDPMRMSWGRMLHEVFVSGATRCWWWIIPPGLCIALIATAFILLGYALDEILNPKLRMRM
ncbi:MAG: ABC transporter permease [Candidatus Bathyarchaeota archaeon]|nr:ABC transporter permease [Candidatus Bathyarchaeota archaeon]